MKTFETPVVDVKKFDVMDILTASGDPCPEFNDCPEFADCTSELPLD